MAGSMSRQSGSLTMELQPAFWLESDIGGEEGEEVVGGLREDFALGVGGSL